MQDLKTFVIEEIKTKLEETMSRNNIVKSSKDLYEAVTLSQKAKKENNPSKIKLSEKAVKYAEKKLLEHYDEYEQGCDCGEGEGKMLQAQLMSIMDNTQKLLSMIDENDQFEDWIQSKITIAEDYMRVAYSYMAYYNEGQDMEVDRMDMDDWVNTMKDGSQQMNIVSMTGVPDYNDALSPDIDDDEIFENKKMKK
jgi:hypothetical protein